MVPAVTASERFPCILGVLLAVGVTAAAASEVCVGFGDLPTNGVFRVRTNFVSGTVNCEIERFQWDTGQWTSNGYASVESYGFVNLGTELPYLWLNNVNVRFDVLVATDLRLKYGAFGGNQNLRINGALTNFGVMQRVNGITLGGVKVSLNAISMARGELRAAGIISDFAIGGQEFAIDNICISPYVGPKFRAIAIRPADDVVMTFSYPGTDASALILEYAESLGSGANWLVDSNATITSTSTGWFQAITPWRSGMNWVSYRLR